MVCERNIRDAGNKICRERLLLPIQSIACEVGKDGMDVFVTNSCSHDTLDAQVFGHRVRARCLKIAEKERRRPRFCYANTILEDISYPSCLYTPAMIRRNYLHFLIERYIMLYPPPMKPTTALPEV